MAADPPSRSWTERILEVLAELMPGRAMASAAEATERGGALAELTALAQGSLALWLAERQQARAGLEGGFDRIAAVGGPVELMRAHGGGPQEP